MPLPDVTPLDPAQADDWLAFFDGPAFADNRDWGGCYCRCFLAGGCGWEEWDAACASGENRGRMADDIRAGRIDGMLARRDGQVVGWLHMGPVGRFQTPVGPAPVERPDVARIVCYVVAAEHRRTGVARALLRGACAELAARGFTSVEATCRADDEHPAMELFGGPAALYLSEGFEQIARSEGTSTVRRALCQQC